MIMVPSDSNRYELCLRGSLEVSSCEGPLKLLIINVTYSLLHNFQSLEE